MSADVRAAARAWRTFRGTGATTTAFLAARLAVVPLGDLDATLRSLKGSVLSLGCGHGILERYLAEINPEVEVEGVELDAARVDAAQRTADRSPRVRVRRADVTKLDGDRVHDAAMAIDVLHHVPADAQPEIAVALYRLVRPGGTLVVKDIATRPRWKHRWNALHDRIVAGPEPVHCRAPEEMAELLATAGFDVDRVDRIGRFSPYPHYLVTATRPA
jgi:2-polyprenyl-3-methyl-5-hydroxy-6-metoxy-1,4-benzoquinol methylase